MAAPRAKGEARESVEQAIAQTERQKRRLLDAYLGGVLELAEFERKRAELDGRRDALLSQKRQLEASVRERVELAEIADSIEKFCERVKAGLSENTFEQRRALVELLIDRVIVTEEAVEIRYVVPASPDGPHQPFVICLQTIYHYFRLWRIDGYWGRMHDALRERARVRAGREATHSAAIIDSQSVKTTEKGGPAATTVGRR